MENKVQRYWDVPAMLFMVVGLWISVQRLLATKWTESLDLAELLLLIGFILGVFLGKSRFPGKVAGWFGFIYTISILPYQIAATLSHQIPWLERYISMGGRLNSIFYSIIHNQPVQDNLLFLFLMVLLYWTVAITAGYHMVRYANPWVPFLIAGAALMIIDLYSTYLAHRDRYTIIYLVCLLCLLGRLYYLKSREEWVKRGITIDSETGFSLGQVMMVGGLVLVLLSWNIPVLAETYNANQPIREKVNGAFADIRAHMTNVFSGLRNPIVYVNDFYGGSLGLGTGAVQGDQVMFRVKVGALSNDKLRFYWRGNSYDYYNGKEWSSTVNDRRTEEPSDWPIEYQGKLGRVPVSLTYEIVNSSMQKVYVPDMPSFVSRPIEYVGSRQGTNGELDIDVIALLAKPILHGGDVITAKTELSMPTEKQLREASTDIPNWVKARYLQLPPHYAWRVQELALELTDRQKTTYDKVIAVTQYLRNTITYEKQIPAPPAGQDPIDWFLFDYKKGFCNYYASAEVLMLRSVGIPARLVTGYAQGDFNSKTQSYEVRVRDSHAWPEVYFAGYGWVEFEPTAGQPAKTLESGQTSSDSTKQGNNIPFGLGGNSRPDQGDPLDQYDRLRHTGMTNPSTQAPFSWPIAIGSVVIIAGLSAFLVWKKPKIRIPSVPVWLEEQYHHRGTEAPRILKRWASYSRLLPIERLFLGVNGMLWALRRKLEGGETPAEQICKITGTVPETQDAGTILLDEYQRAIFSRHGYNFSRARNAYLTLWVKISRFILRTFLRNPGLDDSSYSKKGDFRSYRR